MSESKIVSYSEYTLELKSGGARQGALLRFEFAKDVVGFADCHPWTEFGDDALELQLRKLSRGEFTALTRRSIYFAKIDSQARAAETNLLVGLEIPRSHFLIDSLAAMSEAKLSDLWSDGFRELKIKLGRDLSAELVQLHALLAKSKPFNLRLDFNGRPNIDSLRTFFSQLDPTIFLQLEYIEDPLKASAQEWFELQEELGVTFARDFVAVENSEAHYFVRVIKPAVQDGFALLAAEPASVEVVVTSYLDHPLGQAAAAYTAALLNQKCSDRCLSPGLLHHHVYVKNEFSELLNSNGPKFLPVEGTGFGFDHLLERQKWKGL